MIRHYGDTDFITGLRAIAATMVVILHSYAFLDWGWIGSNITFSGKAGVFAFFVIAGYSVTQSYKASSGFGPYILQRLLRIAPPYFLVLVVVFFLIYFDYVDIPSSGKQFLAEYDFYNLAMHLGFLSFADYRIANSVLSVEWTLPIEVFWYLVLPLVVLSSKRWLHVWIWLTLTYLLAEFTRPVFHFFYPGEPKIATHFFPSVYGFHFVIGVIAHRYREKLLGQRPRLDRWLLAAGAGLFVATTVFGVGNSDRLVAVATCLIICGYDRPRPEIRRILENRVILFVGTISYGVYLLHFPIMFVLGRYTDWTHGAVGFLWAYSLTLLAASGLYVLVERPLNRLGKRLTRPTPPGLTASP